MALAQIQAVLVRCKVLLRCEYNLKVGDGSTSTVCLTMRPLICRGAMSGLLSPCPCSLQVCISNKNVADSTWAAEEGQDFIADHNSSNIDFATIHCWPDNWKVGTRHACNAVRAMHDRVCKFHLIRYSHTIMSQLLQTLQELTYNKDTLKGHGDSL